MIRRLLIGTFIFIASLAGMAQNGEVDRPLTKARFLVSEKMYEDALAALENNQSSESGQMRSALAMGQALSGLGKLDESNKWLIQVSGDGKADAFYCLAKNYLAMNDFSAAIQFLGKHLADKEHYPEKFIRMDPDFSKLENNREWIHLWQTEWYSDPERQTAECEFLISQGQPDEAKSLITQFLATYPDDPRPWFLQSKIDRVLKEERQARQALENAWQLSSDQVLLRQEMLRFALESGFYEQVNNMASELIRQDPTNPEYLITRALIRILDGKESLALKEIESIEDSGIAPAELYYQAGRRFATSIPRQAESYLSKAIATGIMDARYYYTRGIVNSALGKTELALDDLAMSLDINPNQPDLYVERARLRLDLGDTEGACHDWKKALEMGNAKAADLLYKYCKLP